MAADEYSRRGPGGRAPAAALDVAAADVAHRLTQDDGYGSHERALSALAGRCPGFSPEVYESALDRAVELMHAARSLVEENAGRLWEAYSAGEGIDVGWLVSDLRETCLDYPQGVYEQALGFMFCYW